jgi:hypothetical protein
MSVPIPPDRLTALLGRWAHGRGPLYLLLATRLRALIDEDTLQADTRLPPERRLAQALSALYPAHTEEKRWVDGVLARKKGLGL